MKSKFVLLFFLTLLFSCKKVNIFYNLSGVVKYNMRLEKGSVFVYQDSLTLSLDTMKVVSSYVDYIVVESGHANQKEQVQEAALKLQSTGYIGVWPHAEIQMQANAKVDAITASLFHHLDSTSGSGVGFSGVGLYPEPVDNDSTTFYTNGSPVSMPYWFVKNVSVRKWDSMVIKGNVYRDIYENITTAGYINHVARDSLIAYFSTSSGLIKYKIISPSILIIKELVYQQLIRK